MTGRGEGATASLNSSGGRQKEDESRRSSISCAGGSHGTSGGSGGTNTNTTSLMSDTNGTTTRLAANGMKRKLRSVTRAASASRDVFCHILPTKKPRRGFDGKFIRPIGRPPVEGFVWDPVGGYWIPRGVAGISPPKKYETVNSNNNDQQSISSHSSTTTTSSSSNGSTSSSSDDVDYDLKPNSVSPNIRVQLCDSTPSTWNQQQKKLSSSKPKVVFDKDRHGKVSPYSTASYSQFLSSSTAVAATAPPHVRLKHNKSRKSSWVPYSVQKSPLTLQSTTSSVRYHPDSMWNEPRPIDGTVLTLYERHRKPRPVPTGKHSCLIKALQQEFRCVICLGYIRNARVVKECLHRFCEQCIEKALVQFGKRNECPICRVYIPTRRSLAPDPNFDRLIQCILKDMAFEDDDDNITHQLNSDTNDDGSTKNNNSLGMTMSYEIAAARQAAESRTRALQEAIRKKRAATAAPTPSSTPIKGVGDYGSSTATTIIPIPYQQQKSSEEKGNQEASFTNQSQVSMLEKEIEGAVSLPSIGNGDDHISMPPPPLPLVGKTSLSMQQQQQFISKIPIPSPDAVVKIVLRPYKDNSKKSVVLPELQQPFLTISGTATVKVLRCFLELKLGCPRIQICSTIFFNDSSNTTADEASKTKDIGGDCATNNSAQLVIYRDSKTIEEMAIYAARKSTKRRTKVGSLMKLHPNNDIDIGDYIPIQYSLAAVMTTPTSPTNKAIATTSTSSSIKKN
jgi:Zinc finger, C3HC4 type (RING finger)